MKISIFGLGYVGLITGTCLADQGHEIIGVDISRDKVEMINNENTPLGEPGLQERMSEVVRKKHLIATTDSEEALRRSELTMICVGTPAGPNGNPDLDAVENVAREIGHLLAEKDGNHTVILRSTVLPGTGERVIHWLGETSGRDIPGDLEFMYHPEFMREGNAINDFFDPPFVVFGGTLSEGNRLMRSLYPELDAEFIETGIREAEMVKYICNAFHALKIGFANEVGRLSKELNVDSRQVMDLICRDKKLNISDKYLKPGYAFGGSCLPKDLKALVKMSEEEAVEVPILENILTSNDQHVARSFRQITAGEAEKIGIVGLRFKGGTDDLRQSPVVKLTRRLLEEGTEIKIYDPGFDYDVIHGSNREFLDSQIKNVEEYRVDSVDEVLNQVDAIVLGTPEDQLKQDLLEQAGEELHLYDFHGVFDPDEIPENWRLEGLCW